MQLEKVVWDTWCYMTNYESHTLINMTHRLTLRGCGVIWLYMIYDHLHEFHTSVEVISYVFYGIESISENNLLNRESENKIVYNNKD